MTRLKLFGLAMAVVLLTGLDQIIKFSLAGLKSHPLLSNPWFKLVWYENPGIAFSLPLPKAIAIGLIVLVLLILIYLWWQAPGKSVYYSLGLVLAIGGGGE